MYLEIIDILYIVLIIFTSIIGTLLTIILMRVMKVLNMATEIVDFYNKIKQVFVTYKQIPQIIKNKVSDLLKNEKD